MRHSISTGTNRLLAVFGFLVSLLAAAAAVPQQPPPEPARVISAYNPAKLQKKLNEAAAAGYRIIRAFPGRTLNPAADIFLTFASPRYTETSGAIVSMEKIPSGSANYEYAVIRLHVHTSSWERDINAAAARGFRVVPGNTFSLQQGFVFGTSDVPITIMEKAPGSSGAAHYAVVEARPMDNFERELKQHFEDGYALIWLGRRTDHKMALLEKRGSSPFPARVLVTSKDSELQEKVRAAAGERFCMVASESRFASVSHRFLLVYMEKCDTAPEYTFVKNDKKARAEFDKATADGYRLVPAGIFGETITLVKAPAGKHYEYRFATSSAEMDEATKAGFTGLLLSVPVRLGGVVLEREVTTAAAAPQPRP